MGDYLTEDTNDLIRGEAATFQTVQLVLPQTNGEQTRTNTTQTKRETTPDTTQDTTPDTTPVSMIGEESTGPRPLSWKRVFGLSLVLLSSVLYCVSIGLAKQTEGVGSPEICCVQCTVCLGMLSLLVTHQGLPVTVSRNKVNTLTWDCYIYLLKLCTKTVPQSMIYCSQYRNDYKTNNS